MFIGTVNVDETTHGFADKIYDRAQLIELKVSRDLLSDRIGTAPWGPKALDIWDALTDVAPFAYRIVDEIVAYVDAGAKIGVAWESLFDEQVLQKILPKVRGADPRVGDALQDLVAMTDALPLTHAKAKSMLEMFLSHGFTSYF